MNLLLNPTLLLGLLLSVAYASAFHLWTGRTLKDLLLYLVAAAIGFGIGQWVGGSLQLDLVRVGQIYLFETLVGAILALLIVRTITR